MKYFLKRQRLFLGLAVMICLLTVIAVISCRETYETSGPEMLVTGVTLNINVKNLRHQVDEPFTITAAVLPNYATNETVTWTVTPGDVVEIIHKTGKTATITTKNPGQVTITATANGKTNDGMPKTAICRITVYSKDDEIQYTNQFDSFQTARQKNGTFVTALPSISWTRYEAEDAEHFGTAGVSTNDPNLYSGGEYVNRFDNNIAAADFPANWTDVNYVKFSVYVMEDGDYDVDIITNGPDNKTIIIKVNDDPNKTHSIIYASGGEWSTMYAIRFKLGLLKDVPNHILISGYVGVYNDNAPWMNIDCIDVNSKHPDYTPVDNISLNKTTLTLEMGAVSSERLIASITPANASINGVVWTVAETNPPGCVTVDQSGLVTAIQAGTAAVTAAAVDTGASVKTASCSVTVKEAATSRYVTGISVTPASLNLVSGQSAPVLTAVIAPDNATNKVVTWHSSNPAVATVDSAGVVTGVDSGIANIYAQSTHTANGSPVVSNNCVVTVTAIRLLGVTRVVHTGSANTQTAYPLQTGYTRYEAEAGAPTVQLFGSAKTDLKDYHLYSPPGGSGDGVKDIGNSYSAANFPAIWAGINYVTFNVNVQEAGEYQINIITNGPDNKTFMIKVNDNPHQGHAIVYPSTGGSSGNSQWYSIFSIQLGLTFNSGANTVSIAIAENQWANIDCIDVSLSQLN